MKERIKELRKILGLSQADFSKRIGVDATTVSVWERNGKIPQSKLIAICNAFGVNLNWLESGKGKFNEPNDPSVIEERIQDRLRIFRKKLGYTQKDVAEILGVTDITISSWEREGKVPSAKKAMLCQTFGINPKWLDSGEGETFITPPQNHSETAREFAIRNGCEETTAVLFERFMELPSDQKKTFDAILKQLINKGSGEFTNNAVSENESDPITITNQNMFRCKGITFNQR